MGDVLDLAKYRQIAQDAEEHAQNPFIGFARCKDLERMARIINELLQIIESLDPSAAQS